MDHRFSKASGIAHHHWGPRGHRLKRHQAERFVKAGEDGNIGMGIKLVARLLIDIAGKSDLLIEA